MYILEALVTCVLSMSRVGVCNSGRESAFEFTRSLFERWIILHIPQHFQLIGGLFDDIVFSAGVL